MTTVMRENAGSIRAAVRAAEAICALPAVATQDWCDLAAAALLPIAQPGVATILIAQVDDGGQIIRHEASGVAGCYLAEVTTTIGRSHSATSVVPIDARDGNLQRLRTMLAQARDLTWAPGNLASGDCRVGSPEQLGAGPMWRSGPIGRRWEGFSPAAVLCGAAALGPSPAGRAILVEIGITSPVAHLEAHVLEGVLPALARRCVMAIGVDPSDGGQWLTAREQMILKHLLLGKSVREIAVELGRSPHTVHDHVKSLHRKLNANSRGELVARALGHTDITRASPGSGSSINADTVMP